ncbi:hypothetical protein N9515_07060 [Vicingaceae bacterium]|nr:hypothetical protein [Vicingaceae bacterium]
MINKEEIKEIIQESKSFLDGQLELNRLKVTWSGSQPTAESPKSASGLGASIITGISLLSEQF